ncbi:hypothetical protein DFH08DRAFT_1014713 [Mycena albidolilacea]|uniref:Uncharacterized protein n=1 Tax=Mycena albidolilacea TaxID=1033008 RepID=A0AAD7ELM6_9AGAR|nr:hypothetical protein DFH08DRAFT_1014713 [Mycena albidolilacea]
MSRYINTQTEKQLYLAQVKQLRDTFNKNYPEYVYRRRPNNTRKNSSASSNFVSAPSSDDAESNSSPDADVHPALPDRTSSSSTSRTPASSYDHRPYSSPYAPYSFGAGGGGSYGGGSGGYIQTQSYNMNENPHSQQLLSSAYYPPYDTNAQPLPSVPPSSASHLRSPSVGLRKAHSIPSMPSSLSPCLSHAQHHHHTHSGHPQTAPYSPPLSTRYSLYASASSRSSSHSHSSATSFSASPVPTSAYAADSPPAQYGDRYPASSTNSTSSSSRSGYSPASSEYSSSSSGVQLQPHREPVRCPEGADATESEYPRAR